MLFSAPAKAAAKGARAVRFRLLPSQEHGFSSQLFSGRPTSGLQQLTQSRPKFRERRQPARHNSVPLPPSRSRRLQAGPKSSIERNETRHWPAICPALPPTDAAPSSRYCGSQPLSMDCQCLMTGSNLRAKHELEHARTRMLLSSPKPRQQPLSATQPSATNRGATISRHHSAATRSPAGQWRPPFHAPAKPASANRATRQFLATGCHPCRQTVCVPGKPHDDLLRSEDALTTADRTSG